MESMSLKMSQTTTKPFRNQKSTSIYRVNRQVKMKDEELPFTNVMKRIRSPVMEASVISNCNDILQQTYYNTAHPPNRKPLEKLKVGASLATTFSPQNNNNMKSTKFCLYNEEFNKAQHKLATMENAL